MFSLFLMLCCFGAAFSQSNDYYTAAVVEYPPLFNESDSAISNIRRNVEEYVVLIRKAKEENADIVVFPECGLTTFYLPGDRNLLTLYTTVMPDASKKIVPCDNVEYSDVLQRLSCAARNNKIYTVINLAERVVTGTSEETGDNVLIFNSNIVFDRNGAIIAKYHKHNLFGEPGFNRTVVAEKIKFDTDFGVTFGTFICFDILFTKPAVELVKEYKIKHVVYPTAWFSELPFLSAVQVQAGWSRANNVNLLAAGYSDPANTNGGSGIYPVGDVYRYTVPVNKMTSMIIHQISKTNKPLNTPVKEKNFVSGSERVSGRMKTNKENMSNYTTVLINDTNIENKQLCHGKFCCTFTVKFTPTETVELYYRMIIYDGPRSFLYETNNVQICGIAACKNKDVDSCGAAIETIDNAQIFEEISIKGNFRNDEYTSVIPSNVLYDLTVLKPTDFEYIVTDTDSSSSIEMKTTKQISHLSGFGIYGISKGGASVINAFYPLIIINIVYLLTYYAQL